MHCRIRGWPGSLESNWDNSFSVPSIRSLRSPLVYHGEHCVTHCAPGFEGPVEEQICEASVLTGAVPSCTAVPCTRNIPFAPGFQQLRGRPPIQKYTKIHIFLIFGFLVRFWSNMGSRGRGRVCKGFLEHVGFNLTEYGPEPTHGDPIHA